MGNSITVQRGSDGFGSQFLSIISGILYAKAHGKEYLHSPISNIKLSDKSEYQNEEYEKARKLVDTIVHNMGYPNLDKQPCEVRTFLHPEIYTSPEKYFSREILQNFQNSYPVEKPSYYDNTINIAVHIRRGSDILDFDVPWRIVDSKIYDKIISKLLIKYPQAKIHIFSWSDPGLSIIHDNLVYHTATSGNYFLDDFNALVHADILVVGCSSFSHSAAIFNKNIVLYDHNDLWKKQSDSAQVKGIGVPEEWLANYKRIILDDFEQPISTRI